MTRHAVPSARPSTLLLAVAAALAMAGTAAARPAGDVRPRSASPAPTLQALDLERRFDGNDLDLWTTNFGGLASDLATGGPGLEFPRGSGKYAMFAAGLWVGAQVAGEKRVTVAEYAQEWAPGRILGGAPENVNAPGLQSWKVVPLAALDSPDDTALVASAQGDPVRHHAWSA